MPWISWQTMSILEVFESLFTEIRFENLSNNNADKEIEYDEGWGDGGRPAHKRKWGRGRIQSSTG